MKKSKTYRFKESTIMLLDQLRTDCFSNDMSETELVEYLIYIASVQRLGFDKVVEIIEESYC
jgi:hypothetical protein